MSNVSIKDYGGVLVIVGPGYENSASAIGLLPSEVDELIRDLRSIQKCKHSRPIHSPEGEAQWCSICGSYRQGVWQDGKFKWLRWKKPRS